MGNAHTDCQTTGMTGAWSLVRVHTLLFIALIGTATPALVAQDNLQNDLERSAAHATRGQKFDLRYKLTEGEVLRWSVEQIASTDMRMAGYTEESSLRSRSVYAWEVESVDSRGNMTVRNRLESASEWQKIGDEEPISYDSERDTEASDIPDIYLSTAEKVGKPIATTTLSTQGEIVNRVEHITTAQLGTGSLVTPLPQSPVAIGEQWAHPEEIQARHKDRSLKVIKTRVLYTLRDVKEGIATISFRREILTPIEEPWIKMQLQQKINQGTIRFDIARGRILRKYVQWDEQVQGFEGNDSFLRYLGSYDMRIVEDETVGSKATSDSDKDPAQPRTSSYIKPRGAPPVIRK